MYLFPKEDKRIASLTLINSFNFVEKNYSNEMEQIFKKNKDIMNLPFYAAKNSNGYHTHHWNAFAERLMIIKNEDKLYKYNFSEEELIYCKNKLSEIGFDYDKSFIVLHVRDEIYYKNKGYYDNQSKNAKIFNYIKTIQYLADNGYQVIQIGEKGTHKISYIKSFYDYANCNFKSELLDLFLISNCEFFIGTQSGPMQVAQIMGKPIYATNICAPHNITFFNHDLLLIKKFKNKKTQKYLEFDEILNLNFGEVSDYGFDRKGLELEDNAPDEILNGCKIMLKRYMLRNKEVFKSKRLFVTKENKTNEVFYSNSKICER
jgi:putative glycosyltransferase (TIGR04372 family)